MRLAAEGAGDGEGVDIALHVRAFGRLAAPPGGDVWQLQRLAEQPVAERGQEAQERVGLHDAGARHVGDHSPARPDRFQQRRHAQARRAVQLHGIDEVGVHAPPDHVGPLQPGDGADVDDAVAHHEVVAFYQQEAR